MAVSVAKNTLFMTSASVLQKIVSFGYFTFLARSIGVEGTGKYFFALSFTTVFVVFADLGFTNVLVREASRAREKLQRYLSTTLAVKIFFGLLTYVAVVVTINALGYPPETKLLVYVSGITMLFDTAHLTAYGSLRAQGDLRYEAMAMFVSQLLTLFLGSYFIVNGFPLVFLILAFTIPSSINALFAYSILYRKYRIIPKVYFDRATFTFLSKIAAPFALIAIFSRIYSYADSILLSQLAGDRAVGIYAIPYKITFAFQFIPLALIAGLYPRFSELYTKDMRRLAHTFASAVKYLLIIVAPISIGIAVLAEPIVLSLYTEQYSAAIPALRILVLSLFFSFLSFPVATFLNACDRQTIQMKIVGSVMIINILLNIMLIPHYEATGAALAAFVGNVLLTIIGYIFARQVTPLAERPMLLSALRILTAALIMGISVWYTNIYSHYILAICAGACVYPVLLYIMRIVNRGDLIQLRQLIRK